MSAHTIKINLPGGFISAGDLYEILVIAEAAGAQNVRFGNRQQLFFQVDADKLDDLETDTLRGAIEYEVDADKYPNIVSSYVCDAIFSYDSWVREGVYRDILDQFNYQPKLKVNIIDQHQTFVPFFTGNFNFISADVSNYWYLYVRFPKTSQYYCWPALIYSDDIPEISKQAETVILKNKGLFYDKAEVDERLFFQMVSANMQMHHQPIISKLTLPDFNLPYYEGFNRYANGKYWLGVYRRTELFGINFLKDVCQLCLNQRIGQVYATSWKSIIIKGIEPNQRKDWGNILDKYRLNVRHASNELNWQVEDLSADGLALKQQLVREFEELDLRTFKLSFAVKTQPKSGLMASIIIRVQPSGTFELLHTRNFNPNSKDYIVYKTRVKQAQITAYLHKLCDTYYDSLQAVGHSTEKPEPLEADVIAEQGNIYQCRYCLTVYDEAYGDETAGLAAGTRLVDAPGYECPVCSAPAENFELMEKVL